MNEKRVCRCLFFLTLLTVIKQIHPSLHEHKNTFVQDENDVQYLLDKIPISINKGFANSVHGAGDSISEENFHIKFQPSILDFQERQLGIPHQETVTLLNKDDNRTIHLSSISGNTQHFHSSFFQDKVIPPLGNTTFNVVFLGREEGEIDSYLFIHTSDGTVKYQVKGISVSSPYRLRPVVGVKLPINASFTPLIYMHNPHSEFMQILEVYSSGREFQLELPTGEVEGSRGLWEIPPYQTKPVIRLHFNALSEKNHTAYIGFRMNNSAEVLIVAVEIEVTNGAGLHWGGDSGIVNFGIGGSHQSPIHYQISLKNSAKKPVKVQNIISTPTSKALKIIFEPIVIPGDTEIPIEVGMLVYDWKAGLDLKHFKGKLMIKSIGPGGSSQKLAIPWIAEVLQGGLEVNTSAAHYCSPHTIQPRNFSVVNKFKLPLAITNISLPFETASFFTISNFIPKILKSGQRDNIFTLSLTHDKKYQNLQLQSMILIHSNVSITEIPLLSYNGKLQKIIPGGRASDKGTMNFGTVSSGTENEGIFALENQNPINIELHGWGVNMPGAVLELMGCQSGPTELFSNGVQNISLCSVTGNQNIKPGYLAIFKIKVKTPYVKEDTIVGDVFVKTTYERLIVPVYMRVAHGKISMKKVTFSNCFPGSICLQQVKVHSTFARSMEVTFIAPLHKDERVKYIPLEPTSYPVISKGDNHIGSIVIDPLITCKEYCYLGLILNSSVGIQWLNTLSLPSHTRDSDLNLLNTRYNRYLNVTSGGSWDNITMQLDTSEVRGYKFFVNMKPYWPSLLIEIQDIKNKSLLSFPLTQVGKISYKNITLHNPTLHPLLIHLVMDWSYPQGLRLFHSLPNNFKPICLECPITIPGEFKLEDTLNEKDFFEQWGISSAPHSLPTVLEPNKTKTIQLSYTPSLAALSSALLYIRNNMTILEVLRLVGRGAQAQFKFGNRKPGSVTPLLFDLTEKYLKDCEIERSRKASISNLTVKRSFMARNTGELSIDVYAFYINGLACEGYGFKVLNCEPFTLQPNGTKKIEIAFTPDFTLSRIERNLFIQTSLGSKIDSNIDLANGMVRLSLLTTVPHHALEACAMMIARPNWENALQWTATGLTLVLFVCVLATAFLEADRILRGALVSMSRGNPTQPPLDLRLLSHSSSIQQHSLQTSSHQHNKEKLMALVDDNNRSFGNKLSKKDDSLPDWSLMNVKRNKEKEVNKGIKIPDWSLEEERRFRIDTESKDTPSLRRCLDVAPLTVDSSSCSKKRSNKRCNAQDIMSESTTAASDIGVVDIQIADKKNSSLIKSSPITNRKGKSYSTSRDEEVKFIDHEVQVDTSSVLTSVALKDVKNDTSKRKQSNDNVGGNINTNNNHHAFRKYDVNTSQKVMQYSEEETSSTTTESSIQEDNAYKDCENTCDKIEKVQRKCTTKKPKSQTIPTMPSLDYKDNYEGDCDDDDYDKEKQDNPNRWRMSITRSGGKHHLTRLNAESSYKLPRQKQNLPRKEKSSQKRRSAEKNQSKVSNGNTLQREEIRPLYATVSSSLPPAPSVCWGENRAKFSDVVARNQENLSPFSNYSNKSHKENSYSVSGSFDVESTESTKHETIQDLTSNEYKFNVKSTNTFNDKNEAFSNSEIFGMHSNSHLNSYFVNTFNEPPYEPELVPYDDLPETDEPLLELENTEDNSHCKLWNDSNYMLNLISENTVLQLDTSKAGEKISNLPDTIKDNWVTVETNWEPLYTRGAVGEERSGVWGINTGGVWAAAPWGAPTPSLTLHPAPLSPSKELSIQERSGFDPFRSLSTIWTPSSSDIWTSKQKE
ncbi:PREDICTED: transmembrane protein 131 [Ceratosolen solmsi marchali]|uniref:Transmembrane protein 131 n=1 Tax=Ceratosolen solmsi marchali TaxID=326594 RepID=A0AAJ6YJV2_9HYME|nr:PREDICTED: transmembrane protein 131 [Ceratosolen solmsi marchali]